MGDLFSRSAVTVSLAAAALVALSTPASAAGSQNSGAKGTTSAPTGIDVSYPQCPGSSLPPGEAFAIVGVTGGLANDYNPCLSAEFAYAAALTPKTRMAPAQLYLNTADPGNAVADWPSPSQPGAFGSAGTTNPYGTCGFAGGTSGTGAESTACAFVYGFDMVAGIRYSTGNVIGDLQDFSQATGGEALYNYPVWLDVETGNSWLSGSAGLAMNIADLQGMIAAIDHAGSTTGAKPVGVYSTSYQFGQVAGTPTSAQAGTLAGVPVWIPGARRESGAVSNCSLQSFTGGPVTITQWLGQTYDGDYSCLG
ncbi:MAG TPA: hypothetical protein VFV02_02715 [Acidimicrobiales bacterium]|nr:hypothetical protein [Acidimicrobiales bacterium]